MFAPLFGHWQGTEELSASPWSAAGTARAALTFRAEIGGAAMVNDYRQVRDDGSEFLAHGVFLVDAGTSVDDGPPVSWWLFDTFALPPEPATGGWRDGALVLTKTTARGRAVHRFGLDGETLTYAIDITLGDAGPQPFLRGRYGALSGH